MYSSNLAPKPKVSAETQILHTRLDHGSPVLKSASFCDFLQINNRSSKFSYPLNPVPKACTGRKIRLPPHCSVRDCPLVTIMTSQIEDNPGQELLRGARLAFHPGERSGF